MKMREDMTIKELRVLYFKGMWNKSVKINNHSREVSRHLLGQMEGFLDHSADDLDFDVGIISFNAYLTGAEPDIESVRGLFLRSNSDYQDLIRMALPELKDLYNNGGGENE